MPELEKIEDVQVTELLLAVFHSILESLDRWFHGGQADGSTVNIRGSNSHEQLYVNMVISLLLEESCQAISVKHFPRTISM